MSQAGGTYWDGGGRGGQNPSWLRSGAREPGARRKKLAGYLRAANELRQSYQQSYGSTWRSGQQTEDIDDGTPGAFPDSAVVRNGEEEMILFPSYARRHVKRKPQNPSAQVYGSSDPSRSAAEATGSGDAEFWRQEWEKYEDDHAVVDVDVRGWIYTPHKGPLNRKHRIFVGLARQLVGISAPTTGDGASSRLSPPGSSPGSRSPSPGGHERIQSRIAKHEEELVSKEAESIRRRGEAEAAKAGKGEYSEIPDDDDDGLGSNEALTAGRRRPFGSPSLGHSASETSLRDKARRELSPTRRREAWAQPGHMNPGELQEANSHLMDRLMPFLVNPMANTTISIFFYNEQKSRQKTVMTDAYGHFNVRAALEFIPTHVRILASDRLSATEEVHIVPPHGVSLISDIDDTIKHTAINSGAREIFRNAFIRQLDDLTIEGVQEWYNSLADLGVQFHYVSNSPWQLYPILSKFFSLAGLPPGSFHLKQYSGMLQGIFEPVAERKKGTLDKIARDFPERRFILVGDSGEADLEVYTDFVLENPGRVLGVFIRDITTPASKGFFDSSMGPLSGHRNSGSKQGGRSPNSFRGSIHRSRIPEEDENDPALSAAIAASLHDYEEERRRFNPSPLSLNDTPETRPDLPPRRQNTLSVPKSPKFGPAMGKLIDFSDDEPLSAPVTPPLPTRPRLKSGNQSDSYLALKDIANGKKPRPPTPPKKPAALRVVSNDDYFPWPAQSSPKKAPPPPKPRRPSSSVVAGSSSSNLPAETAQSNSKTKPHVPPKPAAYEGQHGYISSAREKLSSVYNNLPSASSYWPVASSTSSGTSRPAPPPPPPRRTISSYPIAAAQNAGSRPSSTYHGTATTSLSPPLRYSTVAELPDDERLRRQQRNNSAASITSNGSSAPNKREELWRRRWTKAEQILGEKGVVLRSWRIGSDAMEECLELVEQAVRENQELEEKRSETK